METEGLAKAVEKGPGPRMHSRMHADVLDLVMLMPCHATPHVMQARPRHMRNLKRALFKGDPETSAF